MSNRLLIPSAFLFVAFHEGYDNVSESGKASGARITILYCIFLCSMQTSDRRLSLHDLDLPRQLSSRPCIILLKISPETRMICMILHIVCVSVAPLTLRAHNDRPLEIKYIIQLLVQVSRTWYCCSRDGVLWLLNPSVILFLAFNVRYHQISEIGTLLGARITILY